MKANRKLANMGGWQDRHDSAWIIPKGAETGIVSMIKGWQEYASAHYERYDSLIGEDGVLGPEWVSIGVALLGLLNGELGRLDGGTLDGGIRDFIRQNGGEVPE